MILLFAKSPERGRVKTRLESHIGEAACQRLQVDLIRQMLRSTEQSQLPCSLWLEGDMQVFAESLPDVGDLPIYYQKGQSLGERMLHALRFHLPQSGKVIIVGSDCLDTNASTLKLADSALDEVDMVIQPAMDGGYTLIGFRSEAPDIFSGVEWGSDRVYQQTCQRADRLGLNVALLPTARDLDRLEDLRYFAQSFDWIKSYLDFIS